MTRMAGAARALGLQIQVLEASTGREIVVVNLKTAKALGLAISGSFLVQADVIIE